MPLACRRVRPFSGCARRSPIKSSGDAGSTPATSTNHGLFTSVRESAHVFLVRGKRPLCYYHDDHNSDGRISLWCPLPPGVQEEMVSAEPVRFFAPPTSVRGVFSGWLGVYLDTSGRQRVDWGEVAAIVEQFLRAELFDQLVD